MYDPRQNLIVALDVSSAAAAQKIVAAVGISALTFKVGNQAAGFNRRRIASHQYQMPRTLIRQPARDQQT